MGFKLGYSTLRWREPDLPAALAELKAAGWDGWEGRLPLDWLGTPRRLRRVCDDAGMPMAVFTASGPPDIREPVHVERNRRRMEFAAEMEQDYAGFELFIANYFTPYFKPRYAVTDNLTHPEGVFWYEKQWNAQGECESWARDGEAEATFADGRWLDGHPLNWRRGPCYAHPLMVQEHRHGLGGQAGAIVLMARREDCFGISGYNSYHNSQYLHLGGTDVKAGQRLEMTVRMVLALGFKDLHEEALSLYGKWTEDER